MCYNPKYKTFSDNDLVKLIHRIWSQGEDASDVEKELAWRNAVQPMTITGK